MKIISAVVLVLLIGGCASRGPERTNEQIPTVTYSYNAGDVEEAKQNGAKYCHDNYGRSARILQDVQSGDKRVMTLECVVAQQ